MSDELLLVGATGTVGGEVMRATLARGGRVRALVRSARQLPPGVTPVVGDLRDDRALARALDGVSAALYAEIAARALLDRSIAPGAHPIVGPASLSGAECAELWARALDREVRYVGHDDARWKATLMRTLSGKKRDDFLATYGLLKDFALPTLERDLKATIRLLGRAPRGFESYVHDTLRTRSARAA